MNLKRDLQDRNDLYQDSRWCREGQPLAKLMIMGGAWRPPGDPSDLYPGGRRMLEGRSC